MLDLQNADNIKNKRENNKEPAVVALGMFDGVHLGHRNLLLHAKKLALQLSVKPIAFTFLNHPREVLGFQQKLLTLPEEKKRLINNLGVKVEMITFTQAIKNLEPIEFLNLIADRYHVKGIVCGFNYFFGTKARGDTALLRQYCIANDIALEVISPFKYKGEVVSSTLIRDNLAQGNIQYANELLGAPYFFCGDVVSHKKIGTKLGYPTANIDAQNKFLPKFGVYSSVVTYGLDDNKKNVYNIKEENTIHAENTAVFKSVTNIGIRPSIDDEKVATIEAHLLDYHENIYQKKIVISLFDFMRDEIKFNTMNGLSTQIKQDSESANIFLEQRDLMHIDKIVYKP